MAVGRMGMAVSDFDNLTPDEFAAVTEAWDNQQTALHHDRWEQIRTLAAVVVSPWSKSGVKARNLLPLPWDADKDDTAGQPEMTRQGHNARVRELMGRKEIKELLKKDVTPVVAEAVLAARDHYDGDAQPYDGDDTDNYC